MAVNNETGAVQPIYQIADALGTLKGRRPKLHVDAVQAAGKIPFDFSYQGINSAAISAHKIYGARGIGLLYTASRTESFLKGGGQEGGTRSGTENLFGIWSLMRCLETYAEKSACTAAFEAQKKKPPFLSALCKKYRAVRLFPKHERPAPIYIRRGLCRQALRESRRSCGARFKRTGLLHFNGIGMLGTQT